MPVRYCFSRSFIKEAWIDALACDPVSAFGGVIIANDEIDAETATEIRQDILRSINSPCLYR
jgi:phosphoribosylaminoimidazolecarboxamide formyltransferase/IMP cyclohydrolase